MRRWWTERRSARATSTGSRCPCSPRSGEDTCFSRLVLVRVRSIVAAVRDRRSRADARGRALRTGVATPRAGLAAARVSRERAGRRSAVRTSERPHGGHRADLAVVRARSARQGGHGPRDAIVAERLLLLSASRHAFGAVLRTCRERGKARLQVVRRARRATAPRPVVRPVVGIVRASDHGEAEPQRGLEEEAARSEAHQPRIIGPRKWPRDREKPKVSRPEPLVIQIGG